MVELLNYLFVGLSSTARVLHSFCDSTSDMAGGGNGVPSDFQYACQFSMKTGHTTKFISEKKKCNNTVCMPSLTVMR
jgi:hypothetical protein